MTIIEHSKHLPSSPENRRSYLFESAHEVFERLVRGNGRLAFDVDGVLLGGDSGPDQLTDLSLIQSLPFLDQHFGMCFITARGESILPILRKLVRYPLSLTGPHGIEEGHAWLMDGKVHPLVPDDYISFFQSLRTDLQNNGLVSTWDQVKDVENKYCWGDPRWQGKYTGSLWFRDQNYKFMSARLQEMVTNLSDQAKVAVNCHFNSQPDNDLAWMRIGSANVNKAHRLHTLGLPAVYFCDGPKDSPVLSAMQQPDILLPYMRNTGGLVVAVEASPDKETPEMNWVYGHADITLRSHEELGDLLTLLSQKIMYSSKERSASQRIPLDCRKS